MAAARVVPAFDEVEDGEAGVGLSWEPLSIEQLALERCEEALAERVVVGVADTAHRGPNPAARHRPPKASEVYWQPWSE